MAIFFIFSGCGSKPNQPAPGTSKTSSKKTEATNEVVGDATKGESDYLMCSTCHGENGEGIKALKAPALAGQESYNLKHQLENFKNGNRPHADDDNGALMAPIAKALSPEGIDNIIAYINTLPSPTIEPTLTGGNVEKGKSYYNMICGACHGSGAMGIEALFSPKLVGLQDWYLEHQINNFREGIRGTAEGDVYGAQMHQIAVAIPDDETVMDLIAYINSLNAE